MGILTMSGGGAFYDLDAITADAEDVLEGKVILDKEGEPLEGTMPNNGTVTQILDCGDYYIIPKGYHDGNGKITANDLASQTEADAVPFNIYTGLTGWVNGEKLTGTMPDLSASTTVKYGTGNNTPVILADEPFMGTNTDGVKRLCLRHYNGNGYIRKNTLFGLDANKFGNATTNQVLSGYKFTSANAAVAVGTMTTNAIPTVLNTLPTNVTYLYKTGDTCTSITGGYSKKTGNEAISGAGWLGVPTMQLTSSYMYIYIPTDTSYSGAANMAGIYNTVNKIDITNYSRLYFKFEVDWNKDATSVTTDNWEYQVSFGLTSGGTNADYKLRKRYIHTSGPLNMIACANISSLSGSYYVSVFATRVRDFKYAGEENYLNLKVHAIWLQ